MSNKEIANRIHNILSEKASMGMGYTHGEGKMKGSKTKKKVGSKMMEKSNNPWINFIKKYAKEEGITYAEALRSKKASSEYKKRGSTTRRK